MSRYDIGKELDEQIKCAGWKSFDYNYDYIKFLNDHKEELQLRFLPSDKAFYVYKKRNKIIIREIEIDSIEITNTINYVAYGCGLIHDKKYFYNHSEDIFVTKDDAYKYAELINKRRNIKFLAYEYYR